MKVLVIDIGGSRVKLRISGQREKRDFPSGTRMTARQMAEQASARIADWEFDAISIGFPGPVVHGRPAAEPVNLGKGWLRFDFKKHFKKPVKIINDAAMQALGSYRGGRMLFIGLGTGFGSALVLDNVVVPLELGELAYSKRKNLDAALGDCGLEKFGTMRWENAVHHVVRWLTAAFVTDYVVIGGGNVKRLKQLPRGARRGSNDRAFAGGARLWTVGPMLAKSRKNSWVIA